LKCNGFNASLLEANRVLWILIPHYTQKLVQNGRSPLCFRGVFKRQCRRRRSISSASGPNRSRRQAHSESCVTASCHGQPLPEVKGSMLRASCSAQHSVWSCWLRLIFGPVAIHCIWACHPQL